MAETTGVQQITNPVPQGLPGAEQAAPLVGPRPHSSWVLPAEGASLQLVAGDYEQAARELGVEAAAVHAVAEVEAGGREGFEDKRPKIRYENHWFRRYTNRIYDKTHPHLSCAYKSRQYRKTHALGTQKQQWDLLIEAFKLDPGAAVRACSWGLFQVMGGNYKDGGWTLLPAFVDAMYLSEGQHLRAFMGFCKTNNLVRHLKNHNWAAFASAYNGPSYADNAYDIKMKRAYERYSRG